MFAARTHRIALVALTIGVGVATVSAGCTGAECGVTLAASADVNSHPPFGAQLDFTAVGCDGSAIADLESATFSLTGPAGDVQQAFHVQAYGDNTKRQYSLGWCAPSGASEGTYTLTAVHRSGTGTLTFNVSGAFDGGTCRPDAVSTCGQGCGQPDAPWALYVDETHVYWTRYTEQGAVLRAPIQGEQPTVLAQGFANPRDIGGYDDSIYWLSVGGPAGSGEFINGAVYALKKDLSTGATLGASQSWLGALAVDGTGIFWTQAGTQQGFFSDGRIMGGWR